MPMMLVNLLVWSGKLPISETTYTDPNDFGLSCRVPINSSATVPTKVVNDIKATIAISCEDLRLA